MDERSGTNGPLHPGGRVSRKRRTGGDGLLAGSLHDVTVERLGPGGEGLARASGRDVLVPFAAPGDRLRVRIAGQRAGAVRAEIVETLAAGASRRAPPCTFFGACGGCSLQHVRYPAQLEAKAGFVREALGRVGGIEWKGELPVRSAAEFGWRSRAEVQIARAGDGPPRIGWFRAGTQDVCDVDVCAVLHPAAQARLTALRERADEIPRDATRAVLAAGDGVQADGSALLRIAGLEFAFPAGAFFQGNRLLVETLVEEATGGAAGAVAWDLYAGAGLFTLPLAQRFAAVRAVEEDGAAVRAARGNARRNGLTNVEFTQESVRAFLEGAAAELPRPDLVLLDPPRAGAGKRVAEFVGGSGAAAVTYVSCEPSALARDLRVLVAAGYRLASVVALDLFPQTAHVEAVARLVRTRGTSPPT